MQRGMNMANCCFYNMLAVSPKEESLERLIDIMKYKDPEWYIYRVRECTEEPIYKSDDLYWVRISGDVAWSTSNWLLTEIPENEKGHSDNGTEYTSLVLLSGLLDISFYILSEGDDFMDVSHIHKGKIIEEDGVPVYDGEIGSFNFIDDVKEALRNMDELDIKIKYPEQSKEFFAAIKRLESKQDEDESGYISYRLGGYDYISERPACDVYSDKLITPPELGVWFEE